MDTKAWDPGEGERGGQTAAMAIGFLSAAALIDGVDGPFVIL